MKKARLAVDSWRLLAALAVGYGSLAACSWAAAQCSAASDSTAPPASRAQQQFKEGLRLAQADQIDAAAAVFLRLTQEYPRLPEPYLQLAAMYQEQGNTQGAVDVLRSALEVHTDPTRLQEQLGDLYLQLAVGAYRSALDSDHASAAARKKYSTLEALTPAGVER